jgi:hypothetical protein
MARILPPTPLAMLAEGSEERAGALATASTSYLKHKQAIAMTLHEV